MATGIQWCTETWNPSTGCDRISPGCDNCYALRMAKRLKGMGQAKYQTDGDPRTSGPGFGLAVHPDALDVPLHWRKPRMVFVDSMSDLGHARVPVSFLAQVWAVMALTPQHTYQVLTKRSHRLSNILLFSRINGFQDAMCEAFMRLGGRGGIQFPLPNVWVGASIELDKYAPRADNLRETPAEVRMLSLEPLLGPLPSLSFEGINWVIIGGESGPGARELDLAWVRDLMDRGCEAGAAVFIKQLGSVWASRNGGDGHGGDWDLWPDWLRVREFPRAAEAVPA